MIALKILFLLLSLCALPVDLSIYGTNLNKIRTVDELVLRDEPLEDSLHPVVVSKDAELIKLCRSNLLVLNSTLLSVNATLAACRKQIEYFNFPALKDAPFLKFLLRKVFDLPVGFSSEDVSDRKDYYELILHTRKSDLKTVIDFIESTEAKNTEKVQALLLDAIKISKSSDKTWIQILYEIYCPNLYIYVSVLNLALLVAVAVKYVSLIHIPLFTVLKAILVLILPFDFAFSVFRQYFEKFAEHKSLISKHSQLCDSRSENFLMRYLNHAMNGDSCYELDKAMLIGPVFKVSLSKALSDSLSGAIVGAVETLGISIQSFLASFSWYYLPLVLPCVVLIIVISVCGYLGIRIRLPFNIAAIEIGHRIQLPDLVVPQNNPAIDNVRGVQELPFNDNRPQMIGNDANPADQIQNINNPRVDNARGVQELPFNDNRPQMIGNDANPADQNQIVQVQGQLSEDQGQLGQPCGTAQCSNASSVNLDPEIDDSDCADCPEDPSPSQDVQDCSAGVEDVSTDQNSQDSDGWVMDDVHSSGHGTHAGQTRARDDDEGHLRPGTSKEPLFETGQGDNCQTSGRVVLSGPHNLSVQTDMIEYQDAETQTGHEADGAYFD